MRALINGVEGGAFDIIRGTDQTIVVVIMNDDGSLIDPGATDTVELLAYDYADRIGNLRLDTVGVTEDSATIYGKFSVVLAETDSSSVTPGTYYCYVRYTDANSKVFISRVPTAVTFR